MELKDNSGRLEVELPSALDLAGAGELRDLLLDALAKDSSADMVLNGAAVERIATAAVQVILAGAPAFRTAARQLEIETPSQALATAFRQLGLGADFDKLCVVA